MFSATVHEVAHGWAALRCGDATAKEAGRLTLDPRAHLDGFGSVALPLIMALMGGPMFAFAKPVPYNPNRLRNPRRDEVIVALAGPVSNLLQALVGTALFGMVWSSRAAILSVLGQAGVMWAARITTTYIYVDLTLAFFNLIPFPPLDGSKVIMPLLHGRAREEYYRTSRPMPCRCSSSRSMCFRKLPRRRPGGGLPGPHHRPAISMTFWSRR